MSYPKKSENVRPILVTVLKMQPILVNPVVKMRPHPVAQGSTSPVELIQAVFD